MAINNAKAIFIQFLKNILSDSNTKFHDHQSISEFAHHNAIHLQHQ